MIIQKLLTLSVCGLLLMTAGCSTPAPVTVTSTSTPKIVKIGIPSPVSSSVSLYHQDMLNVTKPAVDAFNKTHTGVQLQLVIEDTKCDGKDASAAIQKLISIDKVDVIAQITCDVDSEVIRPVVNVKNTPTLTSLAGANTNVGGIDSVFTFISNYMPGEAIARYMNRDASTGGIIAVVENYTWSNDIYAGVKKYYKGQILDEIIFESSEKDYAIIAKQVAKSIDKASYIFLGTMSHESTSSFVKALQQEGIRDRAASKIINNQNVLVPDFITQFGSGLEGIKTANRDSVTSSKGKAFLAEYKKTNTINIDDMTVLLYKESIELIIDAVNAGHTTSDSIQQYFNTIKQGATREGYFGNYYFDQYGDAQGIVRVIQEYQSGSFVTVDR